MRCIIQNTDVPRAALIWYSYFSFFASLLWSKTIFPVLWVVIGTVMMADVWI